MTLDPLSPRQVIAATDKDGNVRLTAEGFRYLAALGYKTASKVYDPGNLADGAGETTTVTCKGAILGQFALASFSLNLQSIILTAWISAANTVSVRFQNESGGAVNLASGTLQVRVFN